MKAAQAQPLDEEISISLHQEPLRQAGTEEEGIFAADVPFISSWRYQFVKRLLDLAGAAVVLTLMALPCLLIAGCVACTSPGGVFYREERIGQDGRRFKIWKFRTMKVNASQQAKVYASHSGGVVLEWRMQKRLHDPRITIIGGFLRRWSLDEMPQLINVLRGEMSLIGPRPIVEAETVLYGNRLRYYLAAKPGLSGLWQVSGRSNVGYQHRAWLDELYVRSWSLRSDARIFLRTFPAVLQREGAY